MQKRYDVIIIGAGTAGLAAAKEVSRHTRNFLLIDHGPLGTTCARVGCMPSKALIEMAHAAHRSRSLQTMGIIPGHDEVHVAKVFERVRQLRDHFVQYVVRGIEAWDQNFRQGHARFTGPSTLRVDDRYDLEAKSFIIATGSQPFIPADWPQNHPNILTTDNFFEREHIPQKWAVVGLGPIGLELGQALSFLNLDVHGYDREHRIGGLVNETLNDKAVEILQKDLCLHLGQAVSVEESGGQLLLTAGENKQTVHAVLAALGRKPNVASLELDNTGCTFDAHGLPELDKETLAIKGLPIYMAGDVDRTKTILHEAADEGCVAGYNASHEKPMKIERRTPLTVVFTHPGIASVGRREVENDRIIVGKASYEDQGRAKIMGANQGAVHVYAEATSGRLIGADLIAPEAEHLAHLLAWSVQSQLTVQDMLRLPFYHPTLEEGLRTAVRDACRQLPRPEATMPVDYGYATPGL
ncbi:dihydrolipoyl dehydrogenase [Oligoflexus tunisiensis]|uniref:dihydrolipoyl dehydrogenase n=1 Tax=Oligoflexus tunisiensis TaxID=708132 RepID=UPI000A810E5B|nr:dihydrolipoyl dehydrogenase [Oligoflexus tunisiensis]